MNEDARQLGAFLRARREALAPEAVGLVSNGRRRRVPGLRRDEIAHRANISTDYYTRLEQARVPAPSTTVLAALVDALLLNQEEELYLRDIAHRHLAKSTSTAGLQVPARVLRLLGDLSTQPALVMSPFMHVLAWNRHASALFVDFGGIPDSERNLARLIYLDERLRDRFTDWDEIARACAAIMRTGAARHPNDEELLSLLDELPRRDARFGKFWKAQGVARRPRSRSTYIHPDVGAMVLDWQILTSAESPDHLIAVISPGDSDRSAHAFRALAERQ
ncbi:helix-turn-helix domain-containing protein [Mycolicibacterium sp. jd]|uniref:MmyB family transcriptional regulator n=1 Tax=unclassified Mycolicibacterium TaxID=2636767 RepID=UPI00351AF05E